MNCCRNRCRRTFDNCRAFGRCLRCGRFLNNRFGHSGCRWW